MILTAGVLLAAVGVLLIADVRWSGAPWGVVWALAAAAMWAAYILLGARVATGGNGVDDLAVGFGAAAVLLSQEAPPSIHLEGLAEPKQIEGV